jgi:hypothetical protein
MSRTERSFAIALVTVVCVLVIVKALGLHGGAATAVAVVFLVAALVAWGSWDRGRRRRR